MKTRGTIHAAFAKPGLWWSRKRSVMVVKRIQIQTTNKNISKTRSRHPRR
jgi:hypothetical protein